MTSFYDQLLTAVETSPLIQDIPGGTQGIEAIRKLEGLPGAIQGGANLVENTASGIANILKNPGVFFLGLAIFGLGAMMITFAWGDRIADTAEKILDKIPPIPVE